MSDLYPTKTRLALLQAVDDGAVTECYYGIFPSRDWSCLDHGPGSDPPRFQKVTARVRELRSAGWIELGDKTHDGYKAPHLWKLTPAGAAVLDAAGGVRRV